MRMWWPAQQAHAALTPNRVPTVLAAIAAQWGRLRTQIFGFMMVGILFMVAAIWCGTFASIIACSTTPLAHALHFRVIMQSITMQRQVMSQRDA
jgi:uncharacterized membrane protein